MRVSFTASSTVTACCATSARSVCHVRRLAVPQRAASPRRRIRGRRPCGRRAAVSMPRSLVGTARARFWSNRAVLTRHPEQVVSNKMMKSVTVAVTRLFRHTRLGKTIRETKKYMVRAA